MPSIISPPTTNHLAEVRVALTKRFSARAVVAAGLDASTAAESPATSRRALAILLAGGAVNDASALVGQATTS